MSRPHNDTIYILQTNSSSSTSMHHHQIENHNNVNETCDFTLSASEEGPPCVIVDVANTNFFQNPNNNNNCSDILSSFMSSFDMTTCNNNNTSDSTCPLTSTGSNFNSFPPQRSFLSIANDLPENGIFSLSSDKFKVLYPRLPSFSIIIHNCNVLIKLSEENNHFVLSCHIAAFKSCGNSDVITFNEEPLNQDMKILDLIKNETFIQDGGKLTLNFYPRGSILSSNLELSNYTHFVISFQLINNGNSLVDQISLKPFKIPNIIISMKEDFTLSSKYIIGSLAGRSDSLIKQGTRKIPSPISIKLSKPLIDQYFNTGMKDLYLHVYVKGEDGSSSDDSIPEHNHSDLYCLLKHSMIKVKHDMYSYTIEEELGKLEKGEKKPQKSKFRLGIALTTKFIVKNKDFTKKIVKYKTMARGKSILGWSESTQFSCAKRQEICLKGSKRGRSEIDTDFSSNVSTTSSLVEDSPSQTPHVKSFYSCFNGSSSSITPTLSTSTIAIHPSSDEVHTKKNIPLGASSPDFYKDRSNLVLSLVQMRDEISKGMERQIALQKEFDNKSKTLIEFIERSEPLQFSCLSIPIHFQSINPRQAKEGEFVCIQTSNNNLTSSMSFSVIFNNTELTASGGVISTTAIGFQVPPKPLPDQDCYPVRVISRNPSRVVIAEEKTFIFTYI